jgi:hypothetical protein
MYLTDRGGSPFDGTVLAPELDKRVAFVGTLHVKRLL